MPRLQKEESAACHRVGYTTAVRSCYTLQSYHFTLASLRKSDVKHLLIELFNVTSIFADGEKAVP